MSQEQTKKIEYIAINDLIPYANNARVHSEEQILQIASSIKEFGFNNPVLIDKGNGIIAGHGRVYAARKLGLEEIPVIRIEHLSEAQKKAYILADNKIAMNSTWDDQLLALELQTIGDLGINLSSIGFDTQFINSLILEDEKNIHDSSAKEIDVDSFEMTNKCPKCGFEYNEKT
jgi:ParB-like chromosome segregation protein Spo0J